MQNKLRRSSLQTSELACAILITLFILTLASSSVFYDNSLYAKHLARVHGDKLSKSPLPAATNSSYEEITNTLIEYFSSFGGPVQLQGFTEAEISHLVDVRRLMRLTTISVPVLLMILCYLWSKKQITKRAILAGSALPTILIVLGVFIPFEPLFKIFHYIFFPQGNWVFPVDSLLIQTYPSSFFALMAGSIGIRIILLSAGMGILGYKLRTTQ